MPVVTYEDESGVVQLDCDETFHHEESRPYLIAITGTETKTGRVKIHEDRVITVKERIEQ